MSPFRGVFPVLVTPFDQDGSIDFPSLDRCVEFCMTSGAAGVVTLVNASEFTTIADDERTAITRRVVDVAAHQVPVVVGVAAATARQAASFAAGARAAGADAVMAMAPTVRAASRAQVKEYFTAVAASAELPVFVQNYHGYPAAQLSTELVAELVVGIDGVDYVKEEALPAGQRMTDIIDRCGSALLGIMGGLAGRFVIDEFLRGATGTMPACEIVDVHVALWQSLERGEVDRARQILSRALPLLMLEWLYGATVYKEVLRRRGVIASSTVREPGAATLDARDRRELTALLELLRNDFASNAPTSGALDGDSAPAPAARTEVAAGSGKNGSAVA
jgi:4-hydroxy-tetrahydrodipicolinate synthase